MIHQAKYVEELFSNANGTMVAGRLKDQSNRKPEGYKSPAGYIATFQRVKFQPITHKSLGQWEYWLVLDAVIEPINQIIANLYLSKLGNDEASRKLVMLDPRILAEKLLDCFHRGDCRPLFCDADGEPHQEVAGRIPNHFPTHY